MIVKGPEDVSTAFKVHYNQQLGDPSVRHGGMHHGLWGIDAPVGYESRLWIQMTTNT